MIKREVEQVAEKNGMTEEQAYYWMSKGLYGGDRILILFLNCITILFRNDELGKGIDYEVFFYE